MPPKNCALAPVFGTKDSRQRSSDCDSSKGEGQLCKRVFVLVGETAVAKRIRKAGVDTRTLMPYG